MLFDMLGYLLLNLMLGHCLCCHSKCLSDHIPLHIHDPDLFLPR